MVSKSLSFVAACVLVSVLTWAAVSSAQSLFRPTEEQRLLFALDMIRKGIQQGDTVKIGRIAAPQVATGAETARDKGDLLKDLSALFDAARKNETSALPESGLSTKSEPILRPQSASQTLSLQSFDIVDPRVEIKNDTAIVECDLILWTTGQGDQLTIEARRVKERFLFISGTQGHHSTKTEKAIRLDGASGGGGRSWQLVRSDSLLVWLNRQWSQNSLSERGGKQGD